jgi:hypothetical protein
VFCVTFTIANLLRQSMSADARTPLYVTSFENPSVKRGSV